eukprot:scaffold1598_cov153-Ochromonas_danica.AAC.4
MLRNTTRNFVAFLIIEFFIVFKDTSLPPPFPWIDFHGNEMGWSVQFIVLEIVISPEIKQGTWLTLRSMTTNEQDRQMKLSPQSLYFNAFYTPERKTITNGKGISFKLLSFVHSRKEYDINEEKLTAAKWRNSQTGIKNKDEHTAPEYLTLALRWLALPVGEKEGRLEGDAEGRLVGGLRRLVGREVIDRTGAVGDSEGAEFHHQEGLPAVGFSVVLRTGLKTVGTALGGLEGVPLGLKEGAVEGANVGLAEGATVVAREVGVTDGLAEGGEDGTAVGVGVGAAVGEGLGAAEGVSEGDVAKYKNKHSYNKEAFAAVLAKDWRKRPGQSTSRRFLSHEQPPCKARWKYLLQGTGILSSHREYHQINICQFSSSLEKRSHRVDSNSLLIVGQLVFSIVMLGWKMKDINNKFKEMYGIVLEILISPEIKQGTRLTLRSMTTNEQDWHMKLSPQSLCFNTLQLQKGKQQQMEKEFH